MTCRDKKIRYVKYPDLDFRRGLVRVTAKFVVERYGPASVALLSE
jgi:hypothetical protein